MKTRILLTIGDFNGIGPEIIIKTLAQGYFSKKYELTVVTPISVLEFYSKLLKKKYRNNLFNVISIGENKIKIHPGKISEEAGYIAGLSLKIAVELCLKKEFDAIVTAPLSKKALNLGGFNYTGNTEMITDLCGSKDSVMTMLSNKIIMGFASTHPPLKNAAGLLNIKMLTNKLRICYDTLKKDLGILKPSIGVLSLNPHAGESGQIGKEEINIIEPVIKKLSEEKQDLKISGPFPSDSYFAIKKYKTFNLTFAMYHDQGFIPFKMIAGLNGVNFTAGLEVIRTSPDHGTAFDIAGKNKASEKSLMEAIKFADKIYRMRRNL